MMPSRNFTHPFSFHFCLKDMVENHDKKASEQDTEMEKVKITPKLVDRYSVQMWTLLPDMAISYTYVS